MFRALLLVADLPLRQRLKTFGWAISTLLAVFCDLLGCGGSCSAGWTGNVLLPLPGPLISQ